MALKTTFLKAANGVRLAKTFTQKGTQAYPMVKAMNSLEVETDSLTERLALYREHAAEGNALLKGSLDAPLENESRAGRTERDALTRTLIIDIDDFPISTPITHCDSQVVRFHAEQIIQLLPDVLHNVSYIAHASSSFGRKTQTVSVHIEFELEHAVSPHALKTWLMYLNLCIDEFSDKLKLNATGFSLKWILDPSVADNSKMIYIATPSFNGVDNPFNDDNERWVLVEKDLPSANLINAIGETTKASVQALNEKHINKMRQAMGLPRRKANLQTIITNGRRDIVLTNPNAMDITVVSVSPPFATFNVNGGDSNAYWCRLSNPDVIYNFKGEQPFQFSKANPEQYEAFLERYEQEVDSASPQRIMCFHDWRTDQFYTGLYNPVDDVFERTNSGELSLRPTARSNLEIVLSHYGSALPDPIPSYELVFNPQDSTVFDKSRNLVNRFVEPKHLRELAEIPEDYVGISYDDSRRGENELGAYVGGICPNIHKLLSHVLGNDKTCYEHFINWLANALQYRAVSNTAWVFSGMPGTGKGMFFESVIEPIWTTEYTSRKRLENLEDQFTGGFESKLMIAIDEIHLSSGKNPTALLDKLKNLISESRATIRAMRQEQRDMPVYYNWLLFSNHRDAIRVEAGDRRFNIAPYQDVPLAKIVDDLDAFFAKIATEVNKFATFLMRFNVDRAAARRCIENASKDAMKFAGYSSQELFFDSIITGDLDYFIEYVYVAQADSNDFNEIQRIATAKTIVKHWINAAIAEEVSDIPLDDLRLVYLALYPRAEMSQNKFNSMVRKNGLNVKRKVLAARGKVRVTTTNWKLNEYGDEESLADIRKKAELADLTAVH